MSNIEITSKIEALQEWESILEEAREQVETLRDEIKAEMLKRDTEELEAGRFIVRWTSVVSNRFDTAAFKKIHGELYKAYTKPVASRRFSVSA